MISLTSAVASYYNLKDGAIDTAMLSMAGIMTAITELDVNAFSPSAKQEGNTTLLIISYVSMLTIIVSRVAYVVMKVWRQYQDIKGEQLKQKIKEEEHEASNKWFKKYGDLDQIDNKEQFEELVKRMTEETNKEHLKNNS